MRGERLSPLNEHTEEYPRDNHEKAAEKYYQKLREISNSDQLYGERFLEAKDAFSKLAQINKELDGLLNSQQAKIVRLRFGFDGFAPMTLDQAAKWCGITRERVRQVEIRSVRKIASGLFPKFKQGQVHDMLNEFSRLIIFTESPKRTATNSDIAQVSVERRVKIPKTLNKEELRMFLNNLLPFSIRDERRTTEIDNIVNEFCACVGELGGPEEVIKQMGRRGKLEELIRSVQSLDIFSKLRSRLARTGFLRSVGVEWEDFIDFFVWMVKAAKE